MQLLEIKEKAILIRINKTYQSSINKEVLYDYTRGRCKLNPERAKNARYAIAIYKGIILELYEINDWHKAGTTESSRKPNDKPELNSTKSLIGRFEFKGKLASEEIKNKFVNKSVRHYFVKGNSNPINYEICRKRN
ncbi:hypothetical protein [Flavobacterium sp. CSZ]|uniref:hypothetical protein n=1 Tax=Flavobacterium sp. CSZ TaxID=2783791 RepID=UPI00188A7E37|nr:hypothetical protein [Flavobacterium sp. CSZ]MBF4487230.1 hypothetical protein [Flavobacterium sp. CSZ]